MAIKRVEIDVVVAANPPPPPKPGVYQCGYNFLQAYAIKAGNPPGTSIFDVRWERATTLPELRYVDIIRTDTLDDTQIKLSCSCNNEVQGENVPIRIFAFYEA